jgi:hypothetical protein
MFKRNPGANRPVCTVCDGKVRGSNHENGARHQAALRRIEAAKGEK